MSSLSGVVTGAVEELPPGGLGAAVRCHDGLAHMLSADIVENEGQSGRAEHGRFWIHVRKTTRAPVALVAHKRKAVAQENEASCLTGGALTPLSAHNTPYVKCVMCQPWCRRRQGPHSRP